MQNQLLAAFPDDTLARWQPIIQPVRLETGAVLHAAGQPTSHVYFPLNCVVSVGVAGAAEKALSVCLVGQHGMVGLHVILGAAPVAETSAVLIAGDALRLDAGALLTEFSRGGEVAKLLLARTHAKVTHIAQAAYCSRHHTLEQQLCLRLLQMIDLSGSLDLNLTQGRLADVVGRRREHVNRCLAQLRDEGVMDVARNGQRVLDRPSLRQRACACHAVMADADAWVLGRRR